MSRFHPSVFGKGNANSDSSSSDPPPKPSYDSSPSYDASAHSSWADQAAEEAPDAGWFDSVGRSRGRAGHRSFFLPLHYEPNYRYPLIVWLHSEGYNENQIDHVMPHISVRNYIGAGVRGVRAVDSLGHRFDWPTSPAAIAAAEECVWQTVDDASRQFSVHPSRIVLAGYGCGGTMAIRIAMRQPDRFAAAVSMGGPLPNGRKVLANLDRLRQRRLPMLWAWGSGNPRFDHSRLQDDIRLAMLIKARVEVRQYASDDEMDTVALSDVNDWIMRHVVADQPSMADDRWSTSPTAYSAN